MIKFVIVCAIFSAAVSDARPNQKSPGSETQQQPAQLNGPKNATKTIETDKGVTSDQVIPGHRMKMALAMSRILSCINATAELMFPSNRKRMPSQNITGKDDKEKAKKILQLTADRWHQDRAKIPWNITQKAICELKVIGKSQILPGIIQRAENISVLYRGLDEMHSKITDLVIKLVDSDIPKPEEKLKLQAAQEVLTVIYDSIIKSLMILFEELFELGREYIISLSRPKRSLVFDGTDLSR